MVASPGPRRNDLAHGSSHRDATTRTTTGPPRTGKGLMYIVTGAAGFIGSNLVRALNERGFATSSPSTT